METEKLCRSLETLIDLKNTIGDDISSTVKRGSFIRRRTFLKSTSSIKDDKIHLLGSIEESLYSFPAKNIKELPRMLEMVVDIFIAICDDAEASVRLAGEEILNRILNTHISSHPVTILVQLFKAFRQNGSGRCVKAAWSRFAAYSCFIKPQRFRCRAFVENLIPAITDLMKREEEMIHETVAEGFPEIMKSLGIFMQDSDLKTLLRAFFVNIGSKSQPIRRSSASSIADVCRYSKNQSIVRRWILRGLLGSTRSCLTNSVDNSLLCGSLHAIKLILAITETEEIQLTNDAPDMDGFVQILINLIECIQHQDHNVQGFALDAFLTLLSHSTDSQQIALRTAGFFSTYSNSPVDSVSSPDATFDEDELSRNFTDLNATKTFSRAEDFGTVEQPIPSKDQQTGSSIDRSDTMSIRSGMISEAGSMIDDESDVFDEQSNTPDLQEDSRIPLDYIDDDFSKDIRLSVGEDDQKPDGPLLFQLSGSLYDNESRPTYFIARLLCHYFLLDSNGIDSIAKKGIRISLQSLALQCLVKLAEIDPEILRQPRYLSLEGQGPRHVSDATIFAAHEDPLLQLHGATFLTCLMTHQANELPRIKMIPKEMQDLVVGALRNNAANSSQNLLRQMAVYIRQTVVTSNYEDEAVRFFDGILSVLEDRKVTYWLVKVDLCRFLIEVPLRDLENIEKRLLLSEKTYGVRRKLQQRIFQCLWRLLADEDHRIRDAAAETVAWLPFGFGYPESCSLEALTDIRRSFREFISSTNHNMDHCLETGLAFPYNFHRMSRTPYSIADVLSDVVGQLMDALVLYPSKEQLIGVMTALSYLSRVFPPTTNTRAWFGCIDEMDFANTQQSSPAVGILNRILELISLTSQAADLHFQTLSVEVLGNLFTGLSIAVFGKNKQLSTEQEVSNSLKDASLKTFSENLLRHLARVLAVIKAAVDGMKTNDLFPTSKAILSFPSSPAATLPIRKRADTLKKTGKKTKFGSFDFQAKTNLGHLVPVDVFRGLFESVRKAHQRHRAQIGIKDDKFVQLVRSTLQCLYRILEMHHSPFLTEYAEELLAYLKVTLSIDGVHTVYCLEQLLNALFGCNLIQIDCAAIINDARMFFEVSTCFSTPNSWAAFCENFGKDGSFSPQFRALPVGKFGKGEADVDLWRLRWANSLKQRRQESVDNIFKHHSKERRVAMSETIRLFEGVVISSLQMYTSTPDIRTQVQVLDLLILLLQFHVNYNVLDGEHVFLNYILKQVDLIELGHIQQVEIILPYLFQFLIGLSHDKHISQQNILTCGHIMQHCDRLMVEGSGRKRMLPVLQLLFNDAFRKRVYKGTSNAGEEVDLEAQVEMVMASALRCLPHPECFSLFHKYLTYQWTKTDGQYEAQIKDVIDGVFMRLHESSIQITCLGDYEQILRFFEGVGTDLLLQSDSFVGYFRDITAAVVVLAHDSSSLSDIALIVSVIELFVATSSTASLLGLFITPGRQHPLEPVGQSSPAESAQTTVRTIEAVILLLQNRFKGQLADFLLCSLLRTLTVSAQTSENLDFRTEISKMRLDTIDHREPYSLQVDIALKALHSVQNGRQESDSETEGRFGIYSVYSSVIWTSLKQFVKMTPSGRASVTPLPLVTLAKLISCEDVLRMLKELLKGRLQPIELEIVSGKMGRDAAEFWRKVFGSLRDSDIADALVDLLGLEKNHAVLMALYESFPVTSDGRWNLTDPKRAVVAKTWTEKAPSQLRSLILRKIGIEEQMDSYEQLQPLHYDSSEKWLVEFTRFVVLQSEESPESVAELLALMDEETLVTIMTDERFPVDALSACMEAAASRADDLMCTPNNGNGLNTVLFHASRSVLLQTMHGIQHHIGWLILADAFLKCTEISQRSNVSIEVGPEAAADVLQFALNGFKMWREAGSGSRIHLRRAFECLLVLLTDRTFNAIFRSASPINTSILQEVFCAFQSACFTSAPFVEPTLETSNLISLCNSLLEHLDQSDFRETDILAHRVIQGICRLPELRNIVHIPSNAVKAGWDTSSTQMLTVEWLEDLDTLKGFIQRLNQFGWTSKAQFEEIWMALLSVISAVPLEDVSDFDESQHENDATSRIVAGRLALKAVTALLLESVLAESPGNPLRNEAKRTDGDTKKIVESWIDYFSPRPRRRTFFHGCHLEDLDQQRCRWLLKESPQTELPAPSGEQVDLRSCLKFLMDLYGHWTSDEKLKRLSPYLLDEISESVFLISEVFYDERNFQWASQFVKQVLKIKNIEESSFYGYLVHILGKSAIALNLDKEALISLRKLTETPANQSTMNRISVCRTLVGLLQHPQIAKDRKNAAWLGAAVLGLHDASTKSRISIGDSVDGVHTVLLAAADLQLPPKSKDTSSSDHFMELIQQNLRNAGQLSLPSLERFVTMLIEFTVTHRFEDAVFREQLVKISLELLHLNPPKSLIVFRLLSSLFRRDLEPRLAAMDHSPLADSHDDPMFVNALEKLAMIQPRISRSFVVEQFPLAGIYLSVALANVPPTEVVNRILAEFRICQPEMASLFAQMTFEVFRHLKCTGQQVLVKEWIVLSLGNFLMRPERELGEWSIACLFCAASEDPVVNKLLGFLLTQSGTSDPVFQKVLFFTAANFVTSLTEEHRCLFKASVANAPDTKVRKILSKVVM